MDNTNNKDIAANNCPKCGGLLESYGNGLVCPFCGYKSSDIDKTDINEAVANEESKQKPLYDLSLNFIGPMNPAVFAYSVIDLKTRSYVDKGNITINSTASHLTYSLSTGYYEIRIGRYARRVYIDDMNVVDLDFTYTGRRCHINIRGQITPKPVERTQSTTQVKSPNANTTATPGETNEVASLVLGIIGVVTSFIYVGFVLGIIGTVLGGKSLARKCKNKVIAGLGLGFSIFAIILSLMAPMSWAMCSSVYFSNNSSAIESLY